MQAAEAIASLDRAVLVRRSLTGFWRGLGADLGWSTVTLAMMISLRVVMVRAAEWFPPLGGPPGSVLIFAGNEFPDPVIHLPDALEADASKLLEPGLFFFCQVGADFAGLGHLVLPCLVNNYWYTLIVTFGKYQK
jgi:hypothetical protein